MTTVLKPIFLDVDGHLSTVPNDSIINIGGVSSSNFTVGGKGLLFDDGTSSAGNGIAFTLQKVYALSTIGNNEAKIKLYTNKDFTIADTSGDHVYFRVSAGTGKITINGDLEVIGSTKVINSTIQDSDHLLISPANPSAVAVSIEPDPGVVPIADLLTVRTVNGGSPVLRVKPNGVVQIASLTVDGKINNVDIGNLQTILDAHLSGSGARHTAQDIAILPTIPGIVSANVYDALSELQSQIVGHTGLVTGYEYVQSTGATIWTINHNRNSRKIITAVYDDQWSQLIPDSVKILDENTVVITFLDSIAGRAVLNIF